MAIRYTSPHHSDDDPGGLIHEALGADTDFKGPAEDILLAWTLRLDADRDPAAVARRLLEEHGLAEGPVPEGAAGRLVVLLRETAASPRDRLHAGRRRRRRQR